MRRLILPMPGDEALAAALAQACHADTGRVETRRFPDGESYVRLHGDPAGRSVQYRRAQAWTAATRTPALQNPEPRHGSDRSARCLCHAPVHGYIACGSPPAGILPGAVSRNILSCPSDAARLGGCTSGRIKHADGRRQPRRDTR